MRRLTAMAGIALMVVAACGEGGPRKTAGSDTPVPGGRLVLAVTGDPKSLNPILTTDTTSLLAWGQLYRGLVTRDPKSGEIVGSLAEKFELAKDGLSVTYTLRDGLVWSDGTPFSGADYKYTAEATLRSKRTTRGSAFDNVVGAKDYKAGKTDGISGVQVGEGGKTITIKLTQTFCTAVEDLSGGGPGGILPSKHFLQYFDPKTTDLGKTIDDNPLNNNPPASMGPWVFKDLKAGDRVTFTKNEKYFKGAPLIDELVIKVYSDQTAIKAALVTGEVTYAGVEPKDFDEVTANEALRGFEFPTFGWTYIGWNAEAAKAPWLAKKEVRQALRYGLNVQAIVDKIVLGHGKPVYATQPPGNAAYNDGDLNKYPNDPKKAKELLEKAGAKMGPDGIYLWTDGSRMRMRLETNQGNNVRETVLQFAQEQYKQIGIEIVPQLESFNTLLERIRCCGTDYEGWISGFTGLGPDPEHRDLWHSEFVKANGFNRSRYRNPAVDRAEDQLRDGPDCSPETRNRLAHEVDKHLNEDAPFTFLYSANDLLFASKTLQSFEPTQFSTSWNVEKWWFKR